VHCVTVVEVLQASSDSEYLRTSAIASQRAEIRCSSTYNGSPRNLRMLHDVLQDGPPLAKGRHERRNDCAEGGICDESKEWKDIGMRKGVPEPRFSLEPLVIGVDDW
jgi:hypothetical protein